MGSAIVNGFFGEESLLADAVGDFGEFALVGANGREVVGQADEVEGAEGFPDLLIAGSNRGNFRAGGYARTRSYGKSADASADGGAEFGVLRAILKFCDQAALVNRGSNSVGVGDAACGGSDDAGGLEENDDLRAACGVAKADQGEGGVSADHRGRIVQHFQEGFVEAGAGGVLAHDPGVGVANFFDRMGGETDHFGIPACGGGVAVAHAFTELN